MIIKVKKILLYGLKKDVEMFFSRSQEAGFMEFIHKDQMKRVEFPGNIHDLMQAIRILKKLPLEEKKQDKLDLSVIVKRVCHLQNSLEELYAEKERFEDEYERIFPFGDFSLQDIEYLKNEGKRFVQFFTIQTSRRKGIELPEDLIYIGTHYDQDYFVSVQKKKITLPKLIEIEIQKPVSMVKEKLDFVRKQIRNLEEELKTYSFYLFDLKKELLEQLNFFYKQEATKKVDEPLSNSFVIVQAWLPLSKEEELKKIINDLSLEYETISIEKEDRIPTYFENKKYARVGEDLVKIYDIPSYEDKDPSSWVLIFFALFYAMIISDAGYGVLYLVISAIFAWTIKSKKPLVVRFKKLCFLLSFCCIGWGLISGSFFGMGLPIKSPLNKYVLFTQIAQAKAQYHLDKKDDVFELWQKKFPELKNVKTGKEFLLICKSKKDGKIVFEALDKFKNAIFMEIALLIGVIHLCFSHLRNLKRNIAGLGWIVFMLGGYLYFPKILQATSLFHYLHFLSKPLAFLIGIWMIIVGLSLVAILGFLQKRWRFITELMNVIQIFADSLSYLRLYALGLAGMILATTTNSIAAKLPIYFGILILLVGHIINFALGIMGGVIHGLRLNFIEWYHYSFEGDGRLFNPLRLLK